MKALVELSGGMDSLVTLATAIKECNEVRCIQFGYGSKHGEYEGAAAREIMEHYDLDSYYYDLTSVFSLADSALIKNDEAIPEGHYEAETMKRTVVPGRNSIFASISLGLAQSIGFNRVYLGIHAGDHHIYPDCRPNWFYSMNAVYHEASESAVVLRAPLLHRTKAEIVGEGLRLGVPFELTRTCYKDQPIACGKCGSCNERLEAFSLNGVQDPIKYERSKG